MRLIPGKTKVKIELFRGITLGDIIIVAVMVGFAATVFFSTIFAKEYIAVMIIAGGVVLVLRMNDQPNYMLLINILRYLSYPKKYRKKRQASKLSEEGEKETTEEDTVYYADGWNESADALPTRHKLTLDKTEEGTEQVDAAQESNTDDKKDGEQGKDKKKNAAGVKKAPAKTVNSKKDPGIENIIPFTGVEEGFINYAGKYLGAVIEISPVEFRFFSPHRRASSIEACLGKVIRSLRSHYSANIVKLDRPIIYENFLKKEYANLDELRASCEKGFLNEEELKSRVEIQYDRIYSIRDICIDNKVIQPFYYLVIFNSDKTQLNLDVDAAITSLQQGEMPVRRLTDEKELAVFLKYTNQIDFDEHEVDTIDPKDYVTWAMPESLSFTSKRVDINNIVTHQMRVVSYPSAVDDAWLASVMSIPATKVVVKFTALDKVRSVRTIDLSLSELRVQLGSTYVDSKRLEIESHIATLEKLLMTLQLDNEALITVNIYISMYDAVKTAEWGHKELMKKSNLPVIADMKRAVRRNWMEIGLKLAPMDFSQVEMFIGSQVSAYDPFEMTGRPMPSNTVAAMYPWIYAHVSDEGGIRLGTQDGVPVFINFFRRDSERVNSNMVIIGKSGAGKSYGTKSLLTNLASEDAKIFILDPENEYVELSHTLHGKMINVGNATSGRLNPFHIIASLDDSEDAAESAKGTGFLSHLQFLEEFFRQILPDLDKDAFEYLIALIERLYTNFGITMETDLTKLGPQDYPIFDDLYDLILEDFQRNNVEYIRKMLQTLINYVSKFASGGRNSNIWNGPSSITTDENFTVFNFQSLLANRNTTIANAQMLLVLKYLDNEIIKNREYNRRYGLNRKIVVIDEAHVFIDTKFPIALDFMFQLAKRIRKYNGMQIVITQNIKDFVGSEEIARKSTAIINACQYSFIFGLAPNDIDDLCRLYEKAGGINEVEQDQILTAPRGMAFAVMSPSSRSTFKISVPQTMVDMFEQPNYQTHYFNGEDGAAVWEQFIGNSRKEHEANADNKISGYFYGETDESTAADTVTFSEITEEEADRLELEQHKDRMKPVVSLTKADTDEDDHEITVSMDEGDAETDPASAPKPAVSVSPVQSVSAAPIVDVAKLIDTIRAEVKREMTVQLAEQTLENAGVLSGSVDLRKKPERASESLEKKPEEKDTSMDEDLFRFDYSDDDEDIDDDYEFDFDPSEEDNSRIESDLDVDDDEDEADDSFDVDDDDDADDDFDMDDDDEDEDEDFDIDDDDDFDLDDDDLDEEITDDDDFSFDDDDLDLDYQNYDDNADGQDAGQSGNSSGAADSGFDLGAILDQHLQNYRNKSLDERMKETQVETMTITIDDLAKYIKDLRKR